jgi:hypothetical protein
MQVGTVAVTCYHPLATLAKYFGGSAVVTCYNPLATLADKIGSR